jgi:hypothetical protein
VHLTPEELLKSEQNQVTSRSAIKSKAMKSPDYQIVLERGEALRPFYELTEQERQEIGLKVFQYVSKLAAQFGSLPVTAKTLKKRGKVTRSVS